MPCTRRVCRSVRNCYSGRENFWGKKLGEGAFSKGALLPSPKPPSLIPLNVLTGGEAVHQEFRWVKNALEEVAVPMKTENPFRAFCGAVGLGSVYVKEARSRTVFIVAFWESRVQGNQSAFSVYERTTRAYKL